MTKREAVDSIEKLNISYKMELIDFILKYIKYIEDLHRTKDDQLVKDLHNWFYNEEIERIIKTTNSLNEGHKEKATKFIKAYSNILCLVEDDYQQLIDQLFFIPEQFIKDLDIKI